MVQELFISLVVVVLKVLSALVLSANALYSGMGILDRLTSGIDEWKEIKKGNAAIAILLVSVMAALMVLVGPRILAFVSSITGDLSPVSVIVLLLVALLNYVLGLLAAIVVIFLAIHAIDRLTHDLDEFAELKKGNVAVALIMAAALFLIVFMASFPLEAAFYNLQVLESAFYAAQ